MKDRTPLVLWGSHSEHRVQCHSSPDTGILHMLCLHDDDDDDGGRDHAWDDR